MIAWWWICVTLAAGVFMGFVLAALLSANGRDYEQNNQLRPAAGITFSFSQSTRINADHRDSVAAFTGGTLTGGMVFHLPSVTNARTLTLNSSIKGLFTTTEQSDIAAHLTGTNWSLSW